MGCALQQPGVNIKNITRIGFPSWRPAQEQRQFAISARVVRKIVIDDQHVTALLHEVFSDTRCRVRGDVDEPGRRIAFRYNYNGVAHGALFAECCDCPGSAGRMHANSAIDAENVFAALIQYGIECDSGFTCLTIAQNQFPLTPADRNQRVDGLDSGLQGIVTDLSQSLQLVSFAFEIFGYP